MLLHSLTRCGQLHSPVTGPAWNPASPTKPRDWRKAGFSGEPSRALGRLLAQASISLALLLLVTGCGTSGDNPTPLADEDASQSEASATEQGPPQWKLETVDTAGLPPLGPNQPPLDSGRVEVAIPQDWFRLPRNQERLIGFNMIEGRKHPAILLTVHENATTETLDETSVIELARQVYADLEANPFADEEQPPEVTAFRLGDFLGVSYLRRGRVKNVSVERLFFVTEHGGRRYKLELRTAKGTLESFRPHLQAVATSLTFPDTDQEANEATP
jgi:hypothetical protein